MSESKLRNKKTGEIKGFGNLQVYAETENTDESQLLGNFNSLEQILEYYEDYTPTEPLIKDEKMRKAVRAWAEANNCKGEVYHMTNWRCSSLVATGQKAEIKFNFELDGLEDTFYYTIEELCGEEKE